MEYDGPNQEINVTVSNDGVASVSQAVSYTPNTGINKLAIAYDSSSVIFERSGVIEFEDTSVTMPDEIINMGLFYDKIADLCKGAFILRWITVQGDKLTEELTGLTGDQSGTPEQSLFSKGLPWF